MTVRVEVVTAERVVFADDVDVLVAPGVQGQLGILTHHTPLMTTLEPGELLMRKSGQEFILAISGGFLEVRPDRIIVLADAAERAEEIDIARAEAAKKLAEERLQERRVPSVDEAQIEAALRRALIRLKVAEKRKKRGLG
jgi:F-type H+-transporting ATPase subunit epsilon